MVRKYTLIIALITVLGTGTAAPTTAQAGSRNFFESVGISTLGGTLLGASTMPFYSQPTQHTTNIVWGAVAGFSIGLGIWLVAILGGSDKSQAQFNPEGLYELERGSPVQAEVYVPLLSMNW